jgi:type VI secretion system protein ImpE
MTAKQLYQEGKVAEAIQSLTAELRDNPANTQQRTFLFELLAFAGEYDRADKHLNVLADSSKQSGLGAMLYLSAIHAERTRQEMFVKRDFPSAEPQPARRGTLNGKPFEEIEDADPRIGARLEVFAAGAYLWIPMIHIESIELQAPKRLRDLLWSPALVRTGPEFKQVEMGECLIPVIAPGSAKSGDSELMLGRKTEWREDEHGPYPLGLKTLLVDGEDIPILEIRKLEFEVPAEQAAEAGEGSVQ